MMEYSMRESVSQSKLMGAFQQVLVWRFRTFELRQLLYVTKIKNCSKMLHRYLEKYFNNLGYTDLDLPYWRATEERKSLIQQHMTFYT